MEKDWPALEDCPQYKYGMVRGLFEKSEWEDAIGDSDEPVYFDTTDSEEEDGFITYKYIPSEVKKFLHQVRSSRGYDLDIWPPSCFDSTFEPVKSEEFGDHFYQLLLNNSIGLIIDHINSKTQKVYTYVNTLRLVYSLNRILLLTFTAKEDAADAVEETFYAAVYAPGNIKDEYELCECFLKPDGPAPES